MGTSHMSCIALQSPSKVSLNDLVSVFTFRRLFPPIPLELAVHTDGAGRAPNDRDILLKVLEEPARHHRPEPGF